MSGADTVAAALQDHPHADTGVLVVVDEKDAMLEGTASEGGGGLGLNDGSRGLDGGDFDSECGALVLARAASPEGAAVGLDHGTGDGEAEPKPAKAPTAPVSGW